MFLLPFIVAFFLLVLFFIYLNYSLSFKRALYVKRMRAYRASWDKRLKGKNDVYSSLSNDGRSLLLNKISIFIMEKKWPEEFSLDEKFDISVVACLPITFRKSNFYPSVKENFSNYSLEDWLSFHEVQFEKEMGRMPLREFDDDFIKYSVKYLNEPKAFKVENERLFKLLNYYYRFIN